MSSSSSSHSTKPFKLSNRIVAFAEKHIYPEVRNQSYIHILDVKTNSYTLNAIKCPRKADEPTSIFFDRDNNYLYYLEYDGFALRDIYEWSIHKRPNGEWNRLYAGIWTFNEVGAGNADTVHFFKKNNKCYFTAPHRETLLDLQQNELPQASLNLYQLDCKCIPLKIKRINDRSNYDHYDSNAVVIANDDNTQILQIQHGAIKKIGLDGNIKVLFYPKTIDEMPDYKNGAIVVRGDNVITFNDITYNEPFIHIIDIKTSSFRKCKLPSPTKQDVHPILIDDQTINDLITFGFIKRFETIHPSLMIPHYIGKIVCDYLSNDVVLLVLPGKQFMYFKISIDNILNDEYEPEKVLLPIAAKEAVSNHNSNRCCCCLHTEK